MLWENDNSRGPFPGLVLVVLLTGCATEQIPEQALRLEESTLEVRSLQTRKLAAPSETAILAATIAVLQDMEFNIDRIEKPLGVISASKVSDADDSGEKTGLFFLDLLCAAGGGGGCDNMSTAKDEQRINLTMVVLPSLERSGEYAVKRRPRQDPGDHYRTRDLPGGIRQPAPGAVYRGW
jgi:hypothetical protein